MSKESRRRQRAESGPAGEPQSPGPTPGPARGRRRERTRLSTTRPSFLERYRSLLVGAAVVAVVAVAGIGIFAAATQPAYACSTEWVPDPTPSPAEGTSPQPGYVQPDMGQGHAANGTVVTFTYCPPASGRHFSGAGVGPIAPRAYGPDDQVVPQGWIHNLEHGALVVLYRGDGEGATPAGQNALRSFFDRYPPSPVCGFQPGSNSGPIFARFDEMATPFAAMVWGRVLPLETLDEAAILQFDATYGERTNPEDFCPDRRVSPSPSAPPDASPSPSAS